MGINFIGIYTFLRRGLKRTFRIVVQTLLAPIISAALYIFIFGTVIGTRIDDFAGVPYISFVFPGILMLSIINSSFGAASSALYFLRWGRGLEEILIAPLSYTEMIIGLLSESLARALIVAFLILGVGIGFGAVELQHPVSFVLHVLGISTIFASLGLLTALWAESFEQLNVVQTFVITPLTYLGGIFYSVTFLPPLASTLTHLNPFFYFADGIRSSMIGYSEADSGTGALVIVGVMMFLLGLLYYLFSIGWKIRY